GSFDCTFPDGPASSTVSVQATDSDGDAGNTDSQLVSIANVAPKVTLGGPAEVDEGSTHSYSFTVSDPGQDSFTIDDGFPSCGGGSYVADSLESDSSGGSFDCSFPD